MLDIVIKRGFFVLDCKCFTLKWFSTPGARYFKVSFYK